MSGSSSRLTRPRSMPTRQRAARSIIAWAMAILGGVAVGAWLGVYVTQQELLQPMSQPELLRQSPQSLDWKEDPGPGVR